MLTKTAKAIFDHLGGNKLRAMVGADNFRSIGNDTLSFRVKAKAKQGIRFVAIALDAKNDRYDVVFYNRSGFRVARTADVGCAELRTVFETTTGLTASL